MIETEGLTKDFDTFRAVESLSLTVEAGTVFALLGPNGAGKTTTVRMLTSILAPTAGWARVAGYDVVQQPTEVRAPGRRADRAARPVRTHERRSNTWIFSRASTSLSADVAPKAAPAAT